MTESTDYLSISHRFLIDVIDSYAWIKANVDSSRASVKSSTKTTLTPPKFFQGVSVLLTSSIYKWNAHSALKYIRQTLNTCAVEEPSCLAKKNPFNRLLTNHAVILTTSRYKKCQQYN